MPGRLVGALLILTVLLGASPVFAARNGCQWCRVWTDPSTGNQESECVNWEPDPQTQPGGAEKLANCYSEDMCYYNWGWWYCYAHCEGYQCFDV